MLIEADGVVEAITPGGLPDQFEGPDTVFDIMSLDVTSPAGPAKLRVVLDGPAPPDVEWRPGLRVRFQIEDHLVGRPEPVFQATLRDMRIVGDG